MFQLNSVITASRVHVKSILCKMVITTHSPSGIGRIEVPEIPTTSFTQRSVHTQSNILL